MKRFVILIVALLVATYVGKAQEVEFTADRPGAATGPATVARGVVQWDGASALPITFLALGLNFSPAEGVGCFIESHNHLQRGASLYCADFGVSYMVCRRV